MTVRQQIEQSAENEIRGMRQRLEETTFGMVAEANEWVYVELACGHSVGYRAGNPPADLTTCEGCQARAVAAAEKAAKGPTGAVVGKALNSSSVTRTAPRTYCWKTWQRGDEQEAYRRCQGKLLGAYPNAKVRGFKRRPGQRFDNTAPVQYEFRFELPA